MISTYEVHPMTSLLIAGNNLDSHTQQPCRMQHLHACVGIYIQWFANTAIDKILGYNSGAAAASTPRQAHAPTTQRVHSQQNTLCRSLGTKGD